MTLTSRSISGAGVNLAAARGHGSSALRVRGGSSGFVTGMHVVRKGVCLHETLWSIVPADRLRSKAVWGN